MVLSASCQVACPSIDCGEAVGLTAPGRRCEKTKPMTDIEKATRLSLDAGRAFPDIPEELAAPLKERNQQPFSTR